LTGPGGQVFGTERVAAQAWDGRRVDELGEDHRQLVLAAGIDEKLQVRDDGPPLGHFQRGARVQEAALHIDHQ
jgi:hypothetical protein